MAKDYHDVPRTAMRRADRAVDDGAWIADLLQREPVATIATVDGDQPFLNSNLFVYDAAAHVIYFHTAKIGRTRANVEPGGRKVCLTVFRMGRLLPADTALEFSVEYDSVIVFGTATVVADSAEATVALQALLDKYAPHLTPGSDYRPPVTEELKRTTVIKIDIEEWTGKRKAVAADFPGAYHYTPPA